MTPQEWLQYANQAATRNQPIDDRLVDAMSFLPEMGITMRVISGGQDGKGEGTRRTGSTRHDHGGAADTDFYMGDRKLDWNNPDDLPIFETIVSRARANGVTGIGAGDDYMGAGRMHIGFGPESAWGAGGQSANAPDWLRTAFAGTPQGIADSTMAALGKQPIPQQTGTPSFPGQPETADPSLYAGLAGILSGEGAPEGDYSAGLTGLGQALMGQQQAMEAPQIVPMQVQPYQPKRREVSDHYLNLFQSLRG